MCSQGARIYHRHSITWSIIHHQLSTIHFGCGFAALGSSVVNIPCLLRAVRVSAVKIARPDTRRAQLASDITPITNEPLSPFQFHPHTLSFAFEFVTHYENSFSLLRRPGHLCYPVLDQGKI